MSDNESTAVADPETTPDVDTPVEPTPEPSPSPSPTEPVADPAPEAPTETPPEPSIPGTDAKVEALAKKYKFKVLDQEREFSEEEIKSALGREDLSKRAHQRFQEAHEKFQSAEQKERDAQHLVRLLKQKGPELLVDLYAADLGDEDQARDFVVEQLKRFLKPIFEERQLPPEQREALRAQKAAERYRQQLEDHQRRAQAEREEQERARVDGEKRQSEIDFENKVVAEIAKFKIPNDEITLAIYQRAKAAAAESGVNFTPLMAAEIIKNRRAQILGSQKPVVAAPAVVAPVAPGVEEDEALREQRLKNLEKAREAKAQKAEEGRRAGKAPAPGSHHPNSRKPRITLEELQERLEA